MKTLSLYFLFLALSSTQAYSKIKIALTFDDGPALSTKTKESPTRMILKTLKEEGIAATFFILTGPDMWMGKVLKRGETPEGFEIIKQTIRDGHLIACHWGGTYIHQKNLHPNRLILPAYDYNLDGVIDKVTSVGNALETDLLQCQERLIQALMEEDIKNERIDFIRPPLWVYKNKNGDARSLYKKMGMKMILTDAKLYDGGFGLQRLRLMLKDMKKAIKSGETDIILTLHDPMRRTARKLKKTIRKIRKKLKNMKLIEGKDWSFTKNKKEMRELLRRKSYFYLNKLKV